MKRAGASRYLVEPNVKEGKGGLRDLNTLFWIAKYVYRVRHAHDLIAVRLSLRGNSRFSAGARNSCGRCGAGCIFSPVGPRSV